MKDRKIFYLVSVSILFIFPFVNFVGAVAQEDYVGFDEEDTFVWTITYDEDAVDEMSLDMGLNISYLDVDEDIEGVKIAMLSIDDEDEHGGDDGVEIEYNYYETEDLSADIWELEDESEKGIIYKYDSDDDGIISYYQYCSYAGVYFVANDVDWDEVVDAWEDDLGNEVSVSNNNPDGSLSIHIYEDFISIANKTYRIHDIYITCRYNGDGVLEYFSYEYYSDTLVLAELETRFFQDYGIFLIIGLIALGGVIVAIVSIIMVTKKKKSGKVKVEKVEVSEEVKQEVVVPKTELIQEARFCPYCGTSLLADGKYCEACGSEIND